LDTFNTFKKCENSPGAKNATKNTQNKLRNFVALEGLERGGLQVDLAL
jgi:hypothetical protein